MTLWYTARQRFGPTDGLPWLEYVEQSRLTHLREVVTLDTALCPPFFEADDNDPELWQHVVMDGTSLTCYFTDLDYLLSYTYERQRFNLLATLLAPEEPCGRTPMEGYDFIGYDLVDQSFTSSALTNALGLDNGLSVRSLNPFGLLRNFDDAYRTRDFLLRRNNHHKRADCDVWAVWRHRSLGAGDVAKHPLSERWKKVDGEWWAVSR